MGQYAPTWAKTEGTGRQRKPTFHRHPWSGEETWLDAHVAQIKPTNGLGSHAIPCPSTPHSSYHVPPLLLCPPSLEILSTWSLPVPSECHFFPRCRSSEYLLSSSPKHLMSSLKSSLFQDIVHLFLLLCAFAAKNLCADKKKGKQCR